MRGHRWVQELLRLGFRGAREGAAGPRKGTFPPRGSDLARPANDDLFPARDKRTPGHSEGGLSCSAPRASGSARPRVVPQAGEGARPRVRRRRGRRGRARRGDARRAGARALPAERRAVGDRAGARLPVVGRVRALGGDARARAAGRPHRAAAGRPLRGAGADAGRGGARAGRTRRVRRVRASVPRLADFAGGELPLRDAQARRRARVRLPDLARARRPRREGDPRARGPARGQPSRSSRRSTRSAPATSTGSRALLDREPELVGEVHGGAWATLLEAIAQPDVVGDDLETRARRRSARRRAAGRARQRARRAAQPGRVLQPRRARRACCSTRAPIAAATRDLGHHAAADGRSTTARPRRPTCSRRSALEPDALYVAAATGRLDALARWFDGDGALRPEAFANRPNLADVGWPPAAPPRDDPQEVLDEAFALAAFSGRLAAMELAARSAARAWTAARTGCTALHLAIIRGRLDVGAVAARPRRGRGRPRRDPRPDAGRLGRAARRAGRRPGSRSATCSSSAARPLAAGDLALAFERAWATWGERGEAELDSGLRYGGDRAGARAREQARGPLLVLRPRRSVRRRRAARPAGARRPTRIESPSTT